MSRLDAPSTLKVAIESVACVEIAATPPPIPSAITSAARPTNVKNRSYCAQSGPHQVTPDPGAEIKPEVGKVLPVLRELCRDPDPSKATRLLLHRAPGAIRPACKGYRSETITADQLKPLDKRSGSFSITPAAVSVLLPTRNVSPCSIPKRSSAPWPRLLRIGCRTSRLSVSGTDAIEGPTFVDSFQLHWRGGIVGTRHRLHTRAAGNGAIFTQGGLFFLGQVSLPDFDFEITAQ